ncbi:MAG: PUA domain-containing protein [Candidatus Thalassarchaeaceae archaeon]
MSEKRLRRRTPVRFKQVKNIIAELSERIGVDIDGRTVFLEKANFDNRDLLLVDKTPLAMQVETEDGRKWFPTLRGILAWQPGGKWAAVDHGAIPFLMNGADCMGAGVQMADPNVEAGELVWVRDETHGKPLALGIAMVNGEEMVAMTKGKAITTLHWVGDELWQLES